MGVRGSVENSELYEQLGPAIPFSFNVNVLYTGREQCDPLHFAGPCYKMAYIMHLVTGGKGILRCNGKEYALSKGDIFIIKPTDYIFYQADEQEPWSYSWVKFDGKSVEYLLENAGINKNVYTVKSEADFNCLLGWFNEMFEYMRDHIAPYFRATGQFYLLFGWFLREFGERSDIPEERMSFTGILDFINHHFTEDIDMAMIEAAANYNRSHIYKIFMRNMNCSPKEYIDTLRLDLACEMLNETGYTINEVALRVGYKSYISFVNAFKKKYGILPTAYRKNEEQNTDRRNENERSGNF